jgi:hypothetical protein
MHPVVALVSQVCLCWACYLHSLGFPTLVFLTHAIMPMLAPPSAVAVYVCLIMLHLLSLAASLLAAVLSLAWYQRDWLRHIHLQCRPQGLRHCTYYTWHWVGHIPAQLCAIGCRCQHQRPFLTEPDVPPDLFINQQQGACVYAPCVRGGSSPNLCSWGALVQQPEDLLNIWGSLCCRAECTRLSQRQL